MPPSSSIFNGRGASLADPDGLGSDVFLKVGDAVAVADVYYSVGLGAKYNVTPEWAVSAGGKYLWFGDAKGQLPTQKLVGDFQDNDGYILGMKLSYQGK